MNKAELIVRLAEKTSTTKKQAEDLLEAYVDIVTETLKAGGEVNIAGFGAFMPKLRKARIGVNPQTKQEIQIAAVTTPKFKAGKGLKEALKHSGQTAAATH